jgi:tetratricopeptide (TPR) repeat protein
LFQILKFRRISTRFIVTVFLFLITQQSQAAECEAARMVSIEGSVERKAEAETEWRPVSQGSGICSGDFVRTGPYSRGGILIDGSETLIRLDQNTTFQLVAPEQKPRSVLDLIKGAVHFISRIPHSLDVRTPFVNAAVEGTEFLVRADDTEASVVLYEGVVLASNEAGSQRLAPGQAVTARKGQAPQLTTLIKPEDAVQWTLHYRPVLHGLVADREHPMSATFRDSLADLRKGDVADAFGQLKHMPPTTRDARFYSFRAGLFLLMGRVDEAQGDLQQALGIDAANSGALALKAMIAVARNEKDRALDLAQKAVATGQNPAVALIALSYAQQASFDLEGALASSEQAVAQSPDNPYAQARMAELRLSMGDRAGAIAAASEAVRLDPEIALGHAMLGFAHLIRVEIAQAKVAFSQALNLDQSDPLPRLGLGLALIREGNLEAGRRELEIATVLDPGNALVRSYMGKAYYEERRDDLAESQYELAKGLDPRDPTPWFYEAILKQQQGMPVEALHSLQTSKVLNDNRAVYRSRLMLDSDEAARNASLGQVYRDLNFEQLALIEGWSSLATDPSEHAGHRLLADTYAHLPRHQVARVSELLQAQLLQPTNSAPVQPLLAETSINIPDGVGPSELGFNEYASLFHRDGLHAQVSAVIGNKSQAGEEILISGVEGNVSYSLGQFHFESDGWRDNNDQDSDIWMGFVQYNLSPDTSVQLEARNSTKDQGDLQMHFYESQFNATQRRQEELDAVRFGLHHKFNPRSELIVSVIRGESDELVEESPVPGVVDVEASIDRDDWSAELRQLMDFGTFRLTGGLGYSKSDVKDIFTLSFFGFPLPPDENDYTDRQRNAYLYSWIDLTDTLTLNLGLSYDEYESGLYEGYKRDRYNPKFGLTWDISPTTTLRAAAYRTLYRQLLTRQTIEPTEVAGFNQFYDAAAGERVEHRGIALDQRFSNHLSGGVEYRHLERTTPTQDTVALSWDEDNRDEELGRIYLYWTPNRRTAVGVEYFYERFHIEDGFIDTTHRFPLSASYFHPSGFGGSLRPTYVRQYGEFPGGTGNDSQDFWNLDLSLDFKLPKHQGQISLEVRNMLNRGFGYEDKDPDLPLFVGERMGVLRVSLSF